MFTLLISLIVLLGSFFGSRAGNVNLGASIGYGVAGFIATQVIIGFIIRKKVTALQGELQENLQAGQKQMNRKIQQFQSKPGGNPKLIQRQIERDQAALIQQALVFTERFAPFDKWTLMLGRQIAAMRLQFHYQLKEFEKVDEMIAAAGIFKGAIMTEAMPVAMKMARQYKKGDIEGAQKTFDRYIIWFRGNRGTLLYGVMSWILVKKGEAEKARMLLDKAKTATGNETFTRNWEMLSNNKVKQFSNANLGDEWYGLYLENPPAPKQQRVRGNARAGRGF